MTARTTDRLAMAFVQLGRDASRDAANERLHRTPLQLVLPSTVAGSETLQVAALLAVEVGRRAFPAGVRAVLGRDGPARTAAAGAVTTLSEALVAAGATLRNAPDPELPSVVVGDGRAELPDVVVAVRAIPRGWAGGAVRMGDLPPTVHPGPLGASISAAIAVSEVFLAAHGLEPRAAARSCGLSTWDPSRCWTDDEAIGPALELLPAQVWLVGVGHLGQAAAWLLRALPYSAPTDVLIALQDPDRIAIENVGTSLFANTPDVGRRKAQVVHGALHVAGFDTLLVERKMDQLQRYQPGEPRFALAGLDSKRARRPLSAVGWDLLIDAGIGAGAHDFTQIIVQRLTVDRSSQRIFAGDDQDDVLDAGAAEGADDPCGVVRAAGEAVGTAFVGAVTAAISLAEAMRPLHEGPSLDLVAVDLRDPDGLRFAVRENSSLEWPPRAPARPMSEGS